MNHRSFNILGNIAVINFSDFAQNSRPNSRPQMPSASAKISSQNHKTISFKEKKRFAEQLLKKYHTLKTILEKSGKFSGRLRKMKTRHLAGEKNKEVLYRENNCVFRFNVDETYFSPRLSNERKEIASMIKENDKVLIMFAGVAPYSIVIAKNSRAKKIYSNEINKKANKYAEMNLELNKVKNKVELIPGDIKKAAEKIRKGKFIVNGNLIPSHFEVIVMPRPRLKDSLLKEAFLLSKKNTRIFYYDFCKVGEENKILEKIKKEARIFHKKIKILNIKKAGEIAPYKIRLRVDFEIL